MMCSWRQAVLNRAAVALGLKGTGQARGSGNRVALDLRSAEMPSCSPTTTGCPVRLINCAQSLLHACLVGS